jgi:hypothetical protein
MTLAGGGLTFSPGRLNEKNPGISLVIYPIQNLRSVAIAISIKTIQANLCLSVTLQYQAILPVVLDYMQASNRSPLVLNVTDPSVIDPLMDALTTLIIPQRHSI